MCIPKPFAIKYDCFNSLSMKKCRHFLETVNIRRPIYLFNVYYFILLFSTATIQRLLIFILKKFFPLPLFLKLITEKPQHFEMVLHGPRVECFFALCTHKLPNYYSTVLSPFIPFGATSICQHFLYLQHYLVFSICFLPKGINK